MNVLEYIIVLCESRNVQYEDIRHTFYYKAFMDLYNKGHFSTDSYGNLKVDNDKVIKRARKLAKNKIFSDDAVYNQKLDLFYSIFKYGSDEVVDTAMSIIAEVDNIQDVPLDQLKALYSIVTNHDHIDNIRLVEIYNNSINKEYEQDKFKEKWEIPYLYELVQDPSIRNNHYSYYMRVLDYMPKAQYTDAAKIMCPFTNQPSYNKGPTKQGILCRVPSSDSVIIDPQTNIIKYRLSKYITDSSEAGLRPTLKFEGNNIPKNNGYVQNDNKITEYGYWPNRIDSSELRDKLDFALKEGNLRDVGSIITGLTDWNGIIHPIISPCYEYDGEIYTFLSARFRTGIGGPIKLSDGKTHHPTESFWTKIEPLKCYVDYGTNRLITADIIISGINDDLVNKYMDSYFTQSLHKFDDYFKTRKPKEVKFPEERKIFIKQINQMLQEPRKDTVSIENGNSQATKVEQSQKTLPVEQSLENAISKYLELDKSNIQISQVDDYIRIVNDIIEQLKSTEGINEDTIDSLRELIKPLEELNDSDNRIKRILEGGPGTKIAVDEQALVIARQLIPKTNQIVEILCQKYNSMHDNQHIANDRAEELKQARSYYRDCSENTCQAAEISADSYKMQDSLHRLIECANSFIKDESFKTRIDERIKPVDDVLNPNNRIKAVIASTDVSTEIEKENQDLINATLDASRLLKPILDVIYEDNNIEEVYIDKKPTQTERKDFFDGVTGFFSSLIPKWGAAEAILSEATSPTQEANNTKKANSKKPIISATIEEVLPILDQFNSMSREKELSALIAMVNSKLYSFDFGRIGDMVFVVLKKQDDGSTYIYTNEPEIGCFEISLREDGDNNDVLYKNNNWVGQERRTMEIYQQNRIPIIKEIKYSVVQPNGVVKKDLYSGAADTISTILNDSIIYTARYSREGDILLKKGINEETITAIKNNLSEVIPADVVEIIQKYSPEIANEIQLGERIFHD